MEEIKNQTKKLVDILKQRSFKMATAESCTGGMVASSVVSIAGASDVFHEGYITYSDDVKEKVLGVDKETLKKYTAVSEQVAKQMALGALKVSDADIAVSTTGYAGPDDAEDGTPAGTVYIGVCKRSETGACVSAKKFKFDGDREQVRRQAVLQAVLSAIKILEDN